MKVDILVAEIGSTTTVVNAFDHINTENPVFIGQGYAKTTVNEGDVTLGLNEAINDLKQKLCVETLEFNESFATSSAAGGLKMSVHGLVYDMTVRAAKEACLGAGANLKMITSGILDEYQLEEIKNTNLNIIMIAGGVDYGETRTAIENAKKIASLHLNIPIIYAGNIQNQTIIKSIFKQEGQLDYLTITDNVYPRIDMLEVTHARKIIQDVFEKHIIKAPGMEKVREMISEAIIPTPGAVLEASLLLQEKLGDLITIDVGGATTDLHSITNGDPQNERKALSPEPFAKRTVEGDLGVYVNKDHVVSLITKSILAKKLQITESELETLLVNYPPIPDESHLDLVHELTYEALFTALERHAGHYIHLYGSNGKQTFTEGKDLTQVKFVIGTGGALTRLQDSKKLIERALQAKNELLLKPRPETKILIDTMYIMSSIGVLSKKYPEASIRLLLNSLK